MSQKHWCFINMVGDWKTSASGLRHAPSRFFHVHLAVYFSFADCAQFGRLQGRPDLKDETKQWQHARQRAGGKYDIATTAMASQPGNSSIRALQDIGPNIPASPVTPPRDSPPSDGTTALLKPIAHSAPSSPHTPSPFRSASPGASPHYHPATGSPSRFKGDRDENRTTQRSSRQREHSAPIRTLFKQTSRRLLAKKQSAGQWRTPSGEGEKMGGGNSKSSISSLSSSKDLLGTSLGKLRGKSRDRLEAQETSREEGRGSKTAALATPTGVADGQFDDAASVPSPGHGAAIDASSALHVEVYPEGIGQPAESPRTAASTSSRPVTFNKVPRVPFGYPLRPQPTDSPFYEDPSPLAPLASATVDAQRRNLAVARKAGFIPAGLAHVRHAPFAQAAREFSGLYTNMVVPATDGSNMYEADLRGGNLHGSEHSQGLMQRIRMAIEDQQEMSPSLAASQVSATLTGLTSAIERGGVEMISVHAFEATKDDGDQHREIFSPNIPQEPITRRIDGTLSKSFAKKRNRACEAVANDSHGAGSIRAWSKPDDGRGEAEVGDEEAGGRHSSQKPVGSVVLSAPSSANSSASSSRSHLPGSDLPTNVRRTASTKEKGHKVYMLPPATVAAPLSYQLSRAKYTTANFKIQPMPIPVPPSLLARSRSDAGRPKHSQAAGDAVAGAAEMARGTKQAQSAPGSTFVRSTSDGAVPPGGNEQVPLPDLSPEEVDALIRTEIRSRTRFVKTPGMEGYSSSRGSSRSSSAAVSRSSSRSSRSSEVVRKAQ